MSTFDKFRSDETRLLVNALDAACEELAICMSWTTTANSLIGAAEKSREARDHKTANQYEASAREAVRAGFSELAKRAAR